jgi:hypothetical protein
VRQTNQRFIKGVNRRLPTERAEPGTLFTLQNARVWVRGATSYIKRILGFSVWDETPIPGTLDMIHAGGKLFILRQITDAELAGITTEDGDILLTETNFPILP